MFSIDPVESAVMRVGSSTIVGLASPTPMEDDVEGVRITFEVPRNRIRLEDGAHLTYQDLALRAPDVVFDSKHQILEATGSPVLEDKADTLRGGRLLYDKAR